MNISEKTNNALANVLIYWSRTMTLLKPTLATDDASSKSLMFNQQENTSRILVVI